MFERTRTRLFARVQRLRTIDHGRALRKLAGVDEETLSWVPHCRPRYTGLGGVVLSTAVIAGLSMVFALSQVLGGFHILVLVPALLWALVILNLDRWLVASTSDGGWMRRTSMLLPRLLVALVLGVVIAEPVVLRIFESAVEQHIRDGRDQQARNLVDELVRCNPASGQPPPSPESCTGKILALDGSPAAVTAELAARERDAAALQESVRTDTRRLGELENLARLECTGGSGPGLTGVAGNGAECRRLRAEADDFRASHSIDPRSAELGRLRGRISALREQANTTRAAYQQTLDTEVGRQVAALRDHQREIGLLERFQALHELSGQNSYLWGATCFVRLLFILLDCLPLLVKLMGGASAYDRLVWSRLASQERIYEEVVRNTEHAAIGELEVQAYEAKLSVRRRKSELGLRSRHDEAEHEQRREEMIADMAARLGGRPRASDHPPPEHNGVTV